jgi:hypothetical protein
MARDELSCMHVIATVRINLAINNQNLLIEFFVLWENESM